MTAPEVTGIRRSVLIRELGLFIVLVGAVVQIYLWNYAPTIQHELALLLGNGVSLNTAICLTILSLGAMLRGNLVSLRFVFSAAVLAFCIMKLAFYLGATEYDIDRLFIYDISSEVRMDDQTAIALGFIAVDQVIRTRFINNAIADLLRFLALVMGLISVADNLLSYTDLEYYFNGVNATSVQTAISLILLSLCQWPDLQNVRTFAELNRVLRLREYALSIAVVLLGFVASEEKLLIEKANAAKAIQGDAERTSRTIIRNFHMVAGVAARVLGEKDSRHRAEMVIGYQHLFEKFGSIFLVVEANEITNGILDRYIEDKFGFEFSFDQANLMELTDLDGNALWISGGIDRAGEPVLVYISSEAG